MPAGTYVVRVSVKGNLIPLYQYSSIDSAKIKVNFSLNNLKWKEY